MDTRETEREERGGTEMETAKVVEESVLEISQWYDFEGVGYIEYKLPSVDTYEEYKALPLLIEYQGRKYGKSCWNSDRFTAYYRTDKVANFAKVVK